MNAVTKRMREERLRQPPLVVKNDEETSWKETSWREPVVGFIVTETPCYLRRGPRAGETMRYVWVHPIVAGRDPCECCSLPDSNGELSKDEVVLATLPCHQTVWACYNKDGELVRYEVGPDES
jgi:hypothetical protein